MEGLVHLEPGGQHGVDLSPGTVSLWKPKPISVLLGSVHDDGLDGASVVGRLGAVPEDEEHQPAVVAGHPPQHDAGDEDVVLNRPSKRGEQKINEEITWKISLSGPSLVAHTG